MRRIAGAVLALTIVILWAPQVRAASPDAIPDTGCTLSGGSLSIASADNGDGDFVVFGLFDAGGDQLARQYIPIYNPDASAELMLTPIGSGSTVHSVKCLAETSLRRCSDPSWAPVDDGVVVALLGFLLGTDYAVVSAKARYKGPEGAPTISIDGSPIGFQLDTQPVQWDTLYDSRVQGSAAFFTMTHGEHSITIGSRDPENANFLPQERICFRT